MVWAIYENKVRTRNFDKYKDALMYTKLSGGIDKDGLLTNGFMIESAKIEVKVIDDSGERMTIEFDSIKQAEAWMKKATKIINKSKN